MSETNHCDNCGRECGPDWLVGWQRGIAVWLCEQCFRENFGYEEADED